MATATAAAALVSVSNGAVMSSQCIKTQRRLANNAVGLNCYGGLKANNNVISIGMPLSTEQCFAKVVSSLKSKASSGGGGGGGVRATCSKIDEIFQIAAIMNGIVLVGVAIGFVLLRIKASIEEAEAAKST